MLSHYGLSGRQELLERLGDIRQVSGFQRMELMDGKGKGNEVIQVRNGSGLQFQISVSRAFDIGLCELYGIPISWLSATGPIFPYFYEKDPSEYQRNSEGGLLTTCGLTYMGKSGVDEGKQLGQHGTISSTSAELLQSEGLWIGDCYELIFRAKVRENVSHGKHLTMYRTISTRLGENQIKIHDQIVNESYKSVEHMVLYHFNFGYPLISETSFISIPDGKRRWINGEGPVEGWNGCSKLSDNATPTVMLHEDLASVDGMVNLVIENRIVQNNQNKKLVVTLQYPIAECPQLTQWKYMAKGVNVLGIEPGNASTEGRHIHRQRGTLQFLQPGEVKEYSFTLNFKLEEE